MVENVADDGVEPKPAIIEASGDNKPTVNVKLKVEIPFQAYIEEKPKPVPTDVAKLRERDDLFGWVRRQAARAGFTISIDISLKRPTFTMQFERSSVHKPPKTTKKPNLKGTGSSKSECSFRLCGFFDKDTNDWWVTMLSGIHNHELPPKLVAHLLVGIIKGELLWYTRKLRCTGTGTRAS
ncbi:hypothetical protein MTR_7g064870 [Medicago truncatula]|uniref:FAR1 DNA-binding domain protein n=1 Tax=Medicago truncatula TaxID=3880 RepID=G7L5J3_MEDTR|nr:hypothetical protein MTR_7g064870 [Medicago truncatula]